MKQGDIPANLIVSGLAMPQVSVNYNVTGKTNALYTVPTGKKFVTTGIIIVPTAVGTLTAITAGSLGTVGPLYNNIMTGFNMSLGMILNKAYVCEFNSKEIQIAQSGEIIYGNITTASGGQLLADTYLLGLLI